MPRARAFTAALTAALLLVLAAEAHAQNSELRVAIYAPWAGPSTADDRFAFAMELEKALVDADLGPAKVSSYAKFDDFQRAVKRKTVDLALVDAAVAGSLPKRMNTVASWSSGERWVLAGAAAMTDLRNKRLALQAADAAASRRLIARLLRGQVRSSYWSLIVGAPVTADARQLVVRKLADVVALPARLAGDLTVLVDLGRFSELAVAISGDGARLTRAASIVRASVISELGGRWTDGMPTFPEPPAPNRLLTAARKRTDRTWLDTLADTRPAEATLSVEEMWIEPNAP